MTTPALHPDAIAAKYRTLKHWSANPDRAEKLTGWKASRLDDGALMLSAQVRGPDPAYALNRFADGLSSYLAICMRDDPTTRLPSMDVSMPGRTAVFWRAEGVWVELWHPDTPSAAPAPVPAPPPAASKRSRLGGRLLHTRRPKTTKGTTR